MYFCNTFGSVIELMHSIFLTIINIHFGFNERISKTANLWVITLIIIMNLYLLSKTINL